MGHRTIRKAIIPAAGLDTRLMPASLATPKAMFPIVCPDGRVRPVLHILIREAVAAGVEKIGLVVSPARESMFRAYFSDHRGSDRGSAELDELARIAGRITYLTQPRPEGFGDAVRCARDFAGADPVLVMLSDHLYLPDGASAMSQVLDCFAAEAAASVVGVGVTPVDELHVHGVVAGDLRGDRLYDVREIVEKPDPQTARDRLVTAGLPADHYLTHVGLYAFAPEVFDVLDELAADLSRPAGELQLTSAQQRLIDKSGLTRAVAVGGQALDMGNPADLVRCQVAMAPEGMPRP